MLTATVLAITQCKKYVCREHADPQNHDICAIVERRSSSEWIEYVGKCPEGKSCHLFPHDDSAVRCREKAAVPYFPGQKIKGPGKCTGKVIDGYCRGKGVDEACTYGYECDVGLTCNMENKCVPAAKEGEFCDKDHNLCKSYLYCREGICIKYGSLRDHVNPGVNDPDLCQSHHIFKGICAPAPRLDGPIFVETTKDVCDYSNKEFHNAECGFHKDGKAICKPGDGDMLSEWHDVLRYLDKQPECSVYLSHLSICDYAEVQFGQEYLRAALSYWKLSHYVIIQENAECTKPYVHSQYFDALSRYNSASSVSALLGLVVALFLLV
eukprot:TRINITY_DN262_c0_g1_i13.p1 TRINITY_DN262_c0_g1~~TRINITY_DN262_c0_g1_i13.p1  ORF type:complete len:324 (+),score=85.19 TRINITY_DN262_c0_g1_i13:47-1018(+)